MSAINEKHSKMLEIVTSFSATWEQLEFTQFHTMSLKAFFTGLELLRKWTNKVCLRDAPFNPPSLKNLAQRDMQYHLEELVAEYYWPHR